jgi:hypothetical protein
MGSSIDPGSPTKRARKMKADQSFDNPESSFNKQNRNIPVLGVKPMYGKDTKQGRYYLDIEDEFSQHLLTGAVNASELEDIKEKNSHKEP